MSKFTKFVKWAREQNPAEVDWGKATTSFPEYDVPKLKTQTQVRYSVATAKGVQVYASKEEFDAKNPIPTPELPPIPEADKINAAQDLSEAVGGAQVARPSTLAQPIGEIRPDIQDLDIPEVSTDIDIPAPLPASTEVDIPLRPIRREATLELPTEVIPITEKQREDISRSIESRRETGIQKAENIGDWITSKFGKFGKETVSSMDLLIQLSDVRGGTDVEIDGQKIPAIDIISQLPKGIAEHFGGYLTNPIEKISDDPVSAIFDAYILKSFAKSLFTGARGLVRAKVPKVKTGAGFPSLVDEFGRGLGPKPQTTPRFLSESGEAFIPTSQELTLAGQQITNSNLYTKHIGEPLYNALLKLGRKLPDRTQNFFLERYGQPAEYVMMSQKEMTGAGLRTESNIAWANEISKGASIENKLKVLESVTDKQRRGAELMRGTPYEPVIRKMNEDMSRLGAELVDLELLTPESYKFFDNRYLAKLHNREGLRIGLGTKKFKETGRLRKRGNEKTVPAEELAQWEAEGYELFKDLGDGKIRIKEFVPYGDIKDPFTLYAKTVADLEQEVGIGRIVKSVSENPKWVSDVPKEGFIKISQNQFGKGINDKFSKIGGLRDKYIQKGIAEDLTELISTRSDWRQLFDEVTSLWKVGKTAYNPATHIRNIFSNVVLADMGGLSPRRIDIYAKALKEISSKGKLYNEAKTGGMFGKEFQFEINQMLRSTKDTKTAPGFFGKLTTAYKTGKPSQWYQAEEQFFKMAKFIQNRQKGLSVTESVADAQKWLFDYSTVSPFVSLGRRTLFPFLTFQAKAFPRIVETAIKHPLRIGKYFLAAEVYDKYSRAKLGLSEEQYQNLKRNMPEYMRNGGMYVLLPEKDRNDNFQFMNMTYFMPWGDMLGGGGKTDSPFSMLPEPLENLVIPSHPILRLPFEINANKSVFTDRPIWRPEESSYKKTAQYIAETMLPPLLGYQGRNVIKKAIQGRPNYFGDIENRGNALLALAGARPIPVNPERVAKFDKIKIRQQIRELESRRISVKRDKSLTEDERDKKSNDIKEQIRELRQQGKEIRNR